MITPQILSLYLGCYAMHGNQKIHVSGVNINSEFIQNIICEETIPIKDIKLILRPLSSMTEEEKKEYRKVSSACKTDNILPEIKVSHILQEHQSERGVKTTIWLLSKGFDLFNLIESNLALDSSKL